MKIWRTYKTHSLNHPHHCEPNQATITINWQSKVLKIHSNNNYSSQDSLPTALSENKPNDQSRNLQSLSTSLISRMQVTHSYCWCYRAIGFDSIFVCFLIDWPKDYTLSLIPILPTGFYPSVHESLQFLKL